MANLWRHPDFLKLWTAQAVSAFGARITREGLPLAAVMTLDAKPAELGLLAAMAMGPGMLVGLIAGGFVDRTSRRAILIGSDLFRFLILMTVPAAAWLHLLVWSNSMQSPPWWAGRRFCSTWPTGPSCRRLSNPAT